VASDFGDILPDAQLEVTFVDGTSGRVDMRAFLNSSKVEGTVFEPLRDPSVFIQAQVVMSATQWPNGADLAPDAMYDAIHETGFGLWTSVQLALRTLATIRSSSRRTEREIWW